MNLSSSQDIDDAMSAIKEELVQEISEIIILQTSELETTLSPSKELNPSFWPLSP